MRVLAMPEGRPIEADALRIPLDGGVEVRVAAREPAPGVLEIQIRYDDPARRGARMALHPRAANLFTAEVRIDPAPPASPLRLFAGETELSGSDVQIIGHAGRVGISFGTVEGSGVRITLETLADGPLPAPGVPFEHPRLFLMISAANLVLAGYRRSTGTRM